MLKCNTCGVNVLARANFVQFPCPKCGKETIIRCSNCKISKNKYTCKSCGFTGP